MNVKWGERNKKEGQKILLVEPFECIAILTRETAILTIAVLGMSGSCFTLLYAHTNNKNNWLGAGGARDQNRCV